MVEELVFLHRIRKVPDSNLCPVAGHPDWSLTWFSSAPPREPWRIILHV